jgi:hypothetical protein
MEMNHTCVQRRIAIEIMLIIVRLLLLQLLAPRFIGFVVAMAMVLILFLFLQYQASRKRNKYKGV